MHETLTCPVRWPSVRRNLTELNPSLEETVIGMLQERSKTWDGDRSTYEQSPKLPNTKICIRWTLVFIKCKKLSLAMGPFQIAIPHVELHECWFRQVLASVIYLGSGLKEKDRERKRKEKEKEKGRKRKRNRKGKGRGNRKERKSQEKGKGKRKKRKRKEKRKDKEREKLKKDTKEKDRKRGSKRKGKEQILQKKNGSVLAIP